MNYTFIHENKEYVLNNDNCEGLFFEDDNEITGLSLDIILEALNNSTDVSFSNEYYVGKCPCGEQEKINKSYRYLEYHFYIYTKNNTYVINTISKEYENTSFNKLFNLGKVDDSYIVNVTVCPICGLYAIEISQCTV
ncbi:DUF3785 domain-containing protein [Clostridium saccharobutylicum]|uniref:DUF3785 domain-containing protein n=1 Tax=Clostridium saccharobutylicum TaxID=169679 RepID=A0A1S8NJM4_CLOSA|nr:DUF3785 domain-containing protein [Clostridium saccharobutylicum]OOM16650.1 hypothetical protein CLOSAC_09220 [Clostridium saccharobutylicum]